LPIRLTSGGSNQPPAYEGITDTRLIRSDHWLEISDGRRQAKLYAACRGRGADSFPRGVLAALTVDFVSAIWEHAGQTKTCDMVVAFTKVERDHFISILQFGQ
jgi:hypothetical protein